MCFSSPARILLTRLASGPQTADGNGALVQPILAFADGDPVYTIFNGVYDWNDQSWHQFSDTQVAPGNTIVASLWRSAGDLYTMQISCLESGWSSTDSYQIVNSQARVQMKAPKASML